MAVVVKLEGSRELQRRLRKLTPSQNSQIMGPALLEMMLLTLRISARDKIYPGGNAPPRPDQITSRTGTLRRSLSASFAVDRSQLPKSIEGGSNVVYAAVHEFGNSRTPKRAFLQPALDDASKQFDDIVVKHWNKQNV